MASVLTRSKLKRTNFFLTSKRALKILLPTKAQLIYYKKNLWIKSLIQWPDARLKIQWSYRRPIKFFKFKRLIKLKGLNQDLNHWWGILILRIISWELIRQIDQWDRYIIVWNAKWNSTKWAIYGTTSCFTLTSSPSHASGATKFSFSAAIKNGTRN